MGDNIDSIIEDSVVDDKDKDEIILKIPIIHTKNNYIVNLDEDIDMPSSYRKVFEVLRTAKKDDIIYFNINSLGGYVDTAIQFFEHIMNTKAKTIAHVYAACSAATMIALCCDEVNISKFGYIMLHNMSSSLDGKVSDMQSYTEFIIKQDKKIADFLYQGFLTPTEIKEASKGKELWLDQQSVIARLKNFKSIKQRKF